MKSHPSSRTSSSSGCPTRIGRAGRGGRRRGAGADARRDPVPRTRTPRGLQDPRSLHVVDRVERLPTGKADYGWARDIALSPTADQPAARRDRRRGGRSGPARVPCTGSSAGHGQPPNPVRGSRRRPARSRPGVHHERAVLRDRLADRPALQQQQLDAAVAAGEQRRGSSARDHGAGGRADRRASPIAHARRRRRRRACGPCSARAPGAASTRARLERDVPDRDVGLGRDGPRVRRRRRAARWPPSAPAMTVISVARPASSSRRDCGDVVAPQHREVRVDHLVGGGQVQPDLEQLERVRPVAVEQREHLASARCPRRR